MRRLRLIASAATAALLIPLGLPGAAQTVHPVEWSPEALTVEAGIGTATSVTVDLTVTQLVEAPNLRVVPELAPYVHGLPTPPEGAEELEPGTYRVSFAIHLPSDAIEGQSVGGTLHLRDGVRTVDQPLPITIVPVAMPIDVDRVVVPSVQRLEDLGGGVLVAVDELVLGVDLDHPQPLAVADEAAGAVGGLVVGGSTDARLFQIHLAGADLDQIQTAIAMAAAIDGVEFAVRHTLSWLAVEPGDPEWDDWDEADPDGNNWHLELVRAPSAWDIETGADVPVAVIDVDFDDGHEDLAFAGVDGVRVEGTGHGTHVAGIACAQGDNDVGVTGVAWDCELRGYEVGVPGIVGAIDNLAAAAAMVTAAGDGARVANISYGPFVDERCELFNNPNLRPFFVEQADLVRRGVVAAERAGGDVLWVQSAGNDSCDVADIPSVAIAGDFPLNYLVVASVNRDGELSNFSNFGEHAQVAAPGGQEGGLFGIGAQAVLSTLPESCFLWVFCGRYGELAGTSQSAPHVTGAAALVLAEHPELSAADVKHCIVTGAEDGGRAVPDHDLFVLDLEAAVRCDALFGGDLDLPPEVDVVFALDLTGSMGGELARVKDEVEAVMETLRVEAPDSDLRFGAVSYEDYNGTFDSRPCGSTYSATYGSSGDRPFTLEEGLTDDTTQVAAAVQALQLGFGNDGPESYGRALWELGTGAVAWRPDALRLVVNFGDNVPHDTDLHEGFGDPLPVPAGLPRDTGVDPGPNEQVDCGGDDIDFHDDALAALEAAGVRLLHVESSGSEAFRTAWRLWASRTGGGLAEMNRDGTIPQGDLADLVIELIRAADT